MGDRYRQRACSQVRVHVLLILLILSTLSTKLTVFAGIRVAVEEDMHAISFFAPSETNILDQQAREANGIETHRVREDMNFQTSSQHLGYAETTPQVPPAD